MSKFVRVPVGTSRFSGLRMLYFVRMWPSAAGRLLRHFRLRNLEMSELPEVSRMTGMERFAHWWTEMVFHLLDVMGISCAYDVLANLVKPSSRGLTEEERKLGLSIFGESINWDLVRIDERAVVGCKQYHFAYVSFFTINSWGKLPADVLIHELVHILQYQQLGGIYIVRALHAQRSLMGYDYGGEANLVQQKALGRGIWDFNLEQQADIVSDYYRLKHGLAPRWGKADFTSLALYHTYVAQLVKSQGRFGGTRI